MKIEVISLRPGVAFTKPVYIEDDNLLVPAGIAVRKRDIQHLSAWGIRTVETDGEMILPRVGKSSETASGQGAPGQEDADAREVWGALKERLAGLYGQLAAGRPSLREGGRVCGSAAIAILKAAQEQKGRLAALTLEKEPEDQADRALNLAILSSRMGFALKLPVQKVFHAVCAAILALRPVPQPLPPRAERYGEDDARFIQNRLAAQVKLCREMGIPDAVARILWQYRERNDGLGLPRKLSGQAIEPGARILAVADTFESLLDQTGRHGSQAIQGALRLLAQDRGRHFDPDAIRTLFRALAVYPAGAIVRLNSGAVARVQELRAAAPLHPLVQILIDPAGRTFREGGAFIDLSKEERLHITGLLKRRPAKTGAAG